MVIKRLYLLGLCFLFGIIIVWMLYAFSNYKRITKNSFVRLLPTHPIIPANILDLKTHGWYLAGCDTELIYLGNHYMPDRLEKIDLDLKNSLSLKLEFPEKTNLYKGCFNIVEGPKVYTLDGNQPALLSGKTSNWKLNRTKKPLFFTQAILASKGEFVLRVVEKGQNKLINFKPESQETERSDNLLEKQLDGIFCTDGNLIKVPLSNKIIYVYYYRNQFICADDNLNLLYKGKTIDTVSRAKIKVAYIKSQDQTTLASPPVYVNKQCAANENYLFIHSGLRADNEVEGTLDKLSVIDVYQVTDGKYKLSFYLPDFNGKKLIDFRVYGQSLYALYDHYLYKYKLNF